MSWKREMLAMVRDRGLYNIITGMDKLPDAANQTITVTTAGVSMVGNTPLLQLQEEWGARNNAAYSQIVLCISPELQISLDHMDQSAEAWNILKKKFKSKDPSKISIIRTQYDNYHMQEGQSVSSYITAMKEFKIQLEKMGKTIANSIHAATLLRNVPESWRPIAQTI